MFAMFKLNNFTLERIPMHLESPTQFISMLQVIIVVCVYFMSNAAICGNTVNSLFSCSVGTILLTLFCLKNIENSSCVVGPNSKYISKRKETETKSPRTTVCKSHKVLFYVWIELTTLRLNRCTTIYTLKVKLTL